MMISGSISGSSESCGADAPRFRLRFGFSTRVARMYAATALLGLRGGEEVPAASVAAEFSGDCEEA
jgi:hypothetical protein